MEEVIKTFKTGVVSYSFFYEFWEQQYSIFERLNFFVDAAWNTDRLAQAINEMEIVIGDARAELNESWKKAIAENLEAGGNCVTTINRLPQ